MVCSLSVSTALAALVFLRSGSCLPPVVLVPGLGGSVINAKLDGTVEPHFFCSTHEDWFVAWLNLVDLVPLKKDCLLANLALTFDNTTFPSKRFWNAKGVTLDSNVDFGGIGGVAYIDPSTKSVEPYFAPMIDNLTATLGYEVGKDLHGAGYDWRLGPLGHAQYDAPGGFYAKLKALIESTVHRNAAKAHLVTHSLGGPTTLAFLNEMDESWLSEHIASFVPVSSPWAGGSRMAMTFVGGDNLGEPIPHDYLIPVQQQAESGVFIMPSGDAWGGQPIVSTPSRNYSVAQLGEMLSDLGLTQTEALLHALSSARKLASQLSPPRVPTHIIYSNGVPTADHFAYAKAFAPHYDAAPTSIHNSDGDGTVNLNSLKWAERTWGASVNFSTFMVHNVAHSDTIKVPAVFEQVIRIVTQRIRSK